ncbi:MAG: hypothetical protein HYT79_03630 [Elusimicrobia bacterium]|nr:hypothetical protein [Elusimicrobiota bacterium]
MNIKNSGLKTILAVSLILMVSMGLFPPWAHFLGGGVSGSVGYGFLFNPSLPSYADTIARVDIPRLTIQWILVLMSAALCFLTLSKNNKE